LPRQKFIPSNFPKELKLCPLLAAPTKVRPQPTLLISEQLSIPSDLKSKRPGTASLSKDRHSQSSVKNPV